jgi:hypothetical protein
MSHVNNREMNSTRPFLSFRKKKVESGIFKTPKNIMVLVKLWFLKLKLVLLPNSLDF